jgi:Tfp pilus assembly protein PilV
LGYQMEVATMRRKRLGGFALIDPLISMLAVAVVMVGAINCWRLAEYKCDKARIDARVAQILRESSDYIAYAPYDLLPADGVQFRSGFLLHPLDPATGTYKDIYPFSMIAAVTTTNAGTAAEAQQIILTLTYNTDPQPLAGQSVQETIRTNALTRVKT